MLVDVLDLYSGNLNKLIEMLALSDKLDLKNSRYEARDWILW